jgi:ABC-2 type transport system permease protein
LSTTEHPLPAFLWRVAEVVRIGTRLYLAENPPAVLATAVWPRAVLQCLFLTLLGRVAGGPAGQQYAFVGSVALIVTLCTTVGIADIPMGEKLFGTLSRIHSGRLSPAVVLAARTVPYLVDALVAVVLCLVIVGPVTGNAALSVDLVPLLPLYCVVIVTSAAAGLACAALAVRAGVDELVGNGLSYLLVAAGGVLIPPGTVGWLDVIGGVLPLRHGLRAIRANLAGEAWFGHLSAELLVGLGWAVLAGLAIARQRGRARDRGDGDFY